MDAVRKSKKIHVLFVCLGNICRSPTAHALFQAHVDQQQLDHRITVDSAGTGAWHSGAPPDDRAQATALHYGYDMSHLRARQVNLNDFSQYDYILAMDQQNLEDLQSLQPENFSGVLGLFLRESGIDHTIDVPDPFYGGQQHFETVVQLIHDAVDGLLQRIKMDYKIT